MVSVKASIAAPLCSRTHTKLVDKISAQLKTTFHNLWNMDGISDNGKSKHVVSFKKKGRKCSQSAKLLFLETEILEQATRQTSWRIARRE